MDGRLVVGFAGIQKGKVVTNHNISCWVTIYIVICCALAKKDLLAAIPAHTMRTFAAFMAFTTGVPMAHIFQAVA